MNRKGESTHDKPAYVNYYRFLCPNHEGVAQYLADDYVKIAHLPYVDGVHLDYVRFPDVVLPVSLWKNYGIEQTSEHPEYDYCYCDVCRTKFKEQTGRDPLELKYPMEDQSWINFRLDAISRVVDLILKCFYTYVIAFNSWQLAVLSVLGTVVSTLTASLSGYDKEDIRNGLYGFNGTLVGIAIGVFMEINVTSILLLISGSVFSTWVARCFRYQNRVSGLTAPFIFVVWLLLVGCHYLYPSLLLSSSLEKPELTMDIFRSFCLNIGQVMFQGNILSGLFFLLGILINSRINALYTLTGAILPLFMILYPHTDLAAWNLGLLGYNGVLCAIALGDKTGIGVVKAIFSIILSIVLQLTCMHMGIVTLTAPFVFSVWITGGLFSVFRSKS